MTAGRPFWQEIVGVEHIWVGKCVLVTVDFERTDDNGGADWQRYVSRRCDKTTRRLAVNNAKRPL